MTESGFDQSASAVATKRPNSAVGGGRSRSPGVAGEVLIRVRESTRLAESSASSWAIPPPPGTPTRCAAESEAVEHAGGVRREVPRRVLGLAGLIGD